MISDAYRFLFPILLLALLCAALDLPTLAVVLLLLALFVCYFFRNPSREIPEGDNLVVSPADGKVVKIAPGDAGDGRSAGTWISIFLNLFDVHVNRSPIAGRLENLEYKRGLFKAAFFDEASQVNEQNIITITGKDLTVTVKQIAGLIARRVVCWKSPGNLMGRGELIGLIRFGSRVDVWLPDEVALRVKLGEHVKGGSSILGERRQA